MRWGKDSSVFSPSLPCVFDFSNAVYSNRKPIDVAISAVHETVANNPGPFTLFVSGGVDSQAMLYAWYLSGAKFVALNVQYVSNGVFFNEDDCADLHAFAGKYGIPIQTRQLDILSFLESELPVLSKTYYCTSPQICTHMKMTDFVDEGTCVFSGNFIGLGAPLDFTILGLARFASYQSRVNLIPYFFLSHPELSVSFLAGINTCDQFLSPYEQKCQLYQRGGLPVIPQHTKLTGFEKIKEYFDDKEHLVSKMDRLRFANRPSKRIFDIKYRYKLSEHVRYVDTIHTINLRAPHEIHSRSS